MDRNRPRRHDRPSELERAKQPIDQRCFEAEASTCLLFTAEGRPAVTHSSNGEPRVRAIIYDPDGWAEYTTPAGVAKLEGASGTVYVAEQYFQARKGRPTYIWQLDPSTHQLDLTVVTDQELIYSSDNLPDGTDPIEDLEMRWSTFLECIQGMRGAFAEDYDTKVELLSSYRHPFKCPALQDNTLLPSPR